MPSCTGLLKNGRPCRYRAKRGEERCRIHKGLFFCRTPFEEGLFCGNRVPAEGRKCRFHEDRYEPPQVLPSQEPFPIRSPPIQSNSGTLSWIRDMESEVLHTTFLNTFYDYQLALMKLQNAIRANLETPDGAPVQFTFGQNVLSLQVCETPANEWNRTGFYFDRTVTEPKGSEEQIHCLICTDSGPRTRLLPCYDKHFIPEEAREQDQLPDGICQNCVNEVLSAEVKPVCPICRLEIPLK